MLAYQRSGRKRSGGMLLYFCRIRDSLYWYTFTSQTKQICYSYRPNTKMMDPCWHHGCAVAEELRTACSFHGNNWLRRWDDTHAVNTPANFDWNPSATWRSTHKWNIGYIQSFLRHIFLPACLVLLRPCVQDKYMEMIYAQWPKTQFGARKCPSGMQVFYLYVDVVLVIYPPPPNTNFCHQ